MKPTNEQLNDVKWWDANQPSDKHVWIEDLRSHEGGDWSGWSKRDGDGFFSVPGADDSSWGGAAEKGGAITIHHKPKDTPYMPEVGEWCDYANSEKRNKYGPLFFVGANQDGELIFSDSHNHLIGLSRGESLQAVKSDEELFIEQARRAIAIQKTGSDLCDMLGDLHKAGFKAPQ